jgi:hypothetical protein
MSSRLKLARHLRLSTSAKPAARAAGEWAPRGAATSAHHSTSTCAEIAANRLDIQHLSRLAATQTQEVEGMGSFDPITLTGMWLVLAGLVLWLVADLRKAK